MCKKRRFYRYFVFPVFIPLLAVAPAMAAVSFSVHDAFYGQSGSVAMDRFAKLVEEKGKGEMKVKTFHGGELGFDRERFAHLKAGSIEMGLIAFALIAAAVPEYGAMDMPYIFKDQDHLNRVASGSVGQAIRQKVLERHGIRILGFMDRSPRHLTTKDRIVRNPEDLKGLRIRDPRNSRSISGMASYGGKSNPYGIRGVIHRLANGGCECPGEPSIGNRSTSLLRGSEEPYTHCSCSRIVLGACERKVLDDKADQRTPNDHR